MRHVLPRFFAPAATVGRGTIPLPADEAHHATRVMRLRAGDPIAVFDGAGHEWRARIAEISKGAVQVELVEAVSAAAEPRVHVTLLHAVLKGDHMDAVVRDATMIGVAAVRPVITARTMASSTAASGARAGQRWTRVAVASAKQCRRAVVPSIAPTARLDGLLGSGFASADQRIVLAEPAAGSPGVELDALDRDPSRAVLAVGPEGGWTADELQGFASGGFQPLTLGTLTLRADAAALIAVSILRARWRDLSRA